MFLAIGKAADDDAREAVLPLQAHEIVLVAGVIQNEAPRFVRNEIAPVLAAGIVDGRFHDLVILGAIAVGEDDEAAFVVIRLIIVVRLAGRDKLRALLRRGRDRGSGPRSSRDRPR